MFFEPGEDHWHGAVEDCRASSGIGWLFGRSVDKPHQEGHKSRYYQDAKYQLDVSVVSPPWPPRLHILVSFLTQNPKNRRHHEGCSTGCSGAGGTWVRYGSSEPGWEDSRGSEGLL